MSIAKEIKTLKDAATIRPTAAVRKQHPHLLKGLGSIYCNMSSNKLNEAMI